MKILAVVFAYNRQAMLDNLLSKLGDVDTVVFDDHSPEPLTAHCKVFRAKFNHGKRNYWRWVNIALRRIRRSEATHFLFLADDLDPIPGAVEAVKSLAAIDCAAINLLKYPYTNNWGHEAKVMSNGMHSDSWVDGCFLCPRETMDSLQWRISAIPRARWEDNPARGSGVWGQVTERIYRFGSVYGVGDSLFKHGDHPSMMNGPERKVNPLKI